MAKLTWEIKQKRPAKFTMKPSTDMPDFYPWWEERPYE
jgi:hypothetical protein